jgi:hypothetical protein
MRMSDHCIKKLLSQYERMIKKVKPPEIRGFFLRYEPEQIAFTL